jgi:hypothetical protein
MSTASVSVTVWPAGIDKFKPEKLNKPELSELY